jgi:four helix bundle protein
MNSDRSPSLSRSPEFPHAFDHERLRAYQEALKFAGWIEPLLAELSGKVAARDQLERASTSIVLNIAEGNGKRSATDRCRYLDIARGSALECAACLDVLVIKNRLSQDTASEGKKILLGVVTLVAGLIARFSTQTHEDRSTYGFENEND